MVPSIRSSPTQTSAVLTYPIVCCLWSVIDMFGLSYTLTIVLLGTVFLGAISGSFGTFIVLRRQALVGDALAHATLPGIVVAFIITQTRSLEWLLMGAAVSALLAMLILNVLKHATNIKFDAGMALILAGFFGMGQMLLSYVQKTGAASQAGLSRFILGQAATMLRHDVVIISIVSTLVLLVMLAFWKELKLFTFDPVFFRTLGLSERFMERLLTLLTVTIVVIGIRTVGVILISALIIAPAVIARQLSNRFGLNIALAGFTGGMVAAVGTLLSATRNNLPTGPVIALLLGVLVLMAIAFAPRRGLLWQALRTRQHQRAIIVAKPLIHLYENRQSRDEDHLAYRQYLAKGDVKVEDGVFLITPQGQARVRALMGEKFS
ncbi:MAG: metal ABC transporter permease [Acholeplasmatales bacterium]|nr:MAG: metal ABC transporter permease [Acholeplasmatales bacterium]